MSFDLERLYNLLPTVYRIRDLEQGRGDLLLASPSEMQSDQSNQSQLITLPLKAFLGVLQEQVAVLEEDLAQLYDDQFIETCAEWVVPYIGDLIEYQMPHGVLPQGMRAEVAQTISYRRRKGTMRMVEELVRTATGWSVYAVEFLLRVATTQHMNHLRQDNKTVEVRARVWEALARIDSPFDTLSHTIDVRNANNTLGDQGRYNVPTIGVFLWRLHAYPLTNSPAFKLDNYRYLFNPLGYDTQLFTNPAAPDKISGEIGPLNVPMPISRDVLEHYLDAYYGPDKSFCLYRNGKPVKPSSKKGEQLSDVFIIQDLSDVRDTRGRATWANMPTDKIAIDPVLGRIVFPRRLRRSLKNIFVTYHYGFSADIGGGEYSRADTFTQDSQPVEHVSMENPQIQTALDKLAGGGTLEIDDSGRYEEGLSIYIAAQQQLEMRAADGHRPLLILHEDMIINGEEGAEVSLNGLVIRGGSIQIHGNMKRIRLTHCTLVPGRQAPDEPEPRPLPSLVVHSAKTIVEIDHCITGSVRVVGEATTRITNSIVDATRKSSVAYAAPADEGDALLPGGPLHIDNCTVIGIVQTVMLERASNTIFSARHRREDTTAIYAAKRQDGCVRYSYLPEKRSIPRTYQCQPQTPADAQRVHPLFTSLRYGDPGYCQLSQRTVLEIRAGADDDAEMGVFHDLHQPQREGNLQLRLKEYLSFRMQTGLFYMT
ncbi:MAG: hypothetical protein NVSMB38_18610 [Ktedonobacteraceae bacterium]